MYKFMQRGTFKKKTYEEIVQQDKKKPVKVNFKRSRGISKTKTKPKKTLSKYKKELDAIFSKYIRYRDAGKCYTCGLQKEPKQMQNGHFVPRQYLAVRWDEINCHCQCYACNMLYNGQPSRYAQRLRQDYGDDIIDTLENKRRLITKLDEIWYEKQINKYKEIVSKIEIQML